MHQSRIMACLWLLAGLAFVSPSSAYAGLTSESVDWLYVRPFVGYELSQFGALNVAAGQTATSTAHGVAFGGEAGLRLGPFGLGALYQRTQLLDDLNNGGAFNKLYGVFNVNIRTGDINGVLTAAFGWSNLATGASEVNGFGAKLGGGLDYYFLEWLSAGLGATFDLQGYIVNGNYVGAYGGTFTARVGFYL